MEKIEFELNFTKAGKKVTFDFEQFLEKLRSITTEEKAFSFVRELDSALFFGMINNIYDKLPTSK